MDYAKLITVQRGATKRRGVFLTTPVPGIGDVIAFAEGQDSDWEVIRSEDVAIISDPTNSLTELKNSLQ